ncbi:hypothetical protein [Brevundimonas poindexterae]|uniref:hypothetical protein n=1 Tax=Brevundimonas poindexterae TaxID=74325 RepID=UPI001CFCF290|nr:hypothetical protein [Brevundimonas poindexterae]
MTYLDPNDPRQPTVIVEPAPAYSETTETVIVRESNTGWWIAGILGGLVLVAVMLILFNRQAPQTEPVVVEREVAVPVAVPVPAAEAPAGTPAQQ